MWGVLVDIAAAVLGVILVGLVRAMWALNARVSRLEGRLDGRHD